MFLDKSCVKELADPRTTMYRTQETTTPNEDEDVQLTNQKQDKQHHVQPTSQKRAKQHHLQPTHQRRGNHKHLQPTNLK